MKVFVVTANVVAEGGWVVGVGSTEEAGQAIAARYVSEDQTYDGTLGAWESVTTEGGHYLSADVGNGAYMFMKVEPFDVEESR